MVGSEGDPKHPTLRKVGGETPSATRASGSTRFRYSPVVSTMPSRMTTISNCSVCMLRWDRS